MQFNSKPIEEHKEVPLADDGRWEDLVAYWHRRDLTPKPKATAGNCSYIVSVVHPHEPHPNGKLTEIIGLVRAQGDKIGGYETHQLTKPHPRTFIGRGTASNIASRASELGADLIVIDAELSPSQMRNLEDATGLPISDREGVILNVFLLHAKTRSARIQVEIAQLEYLRPRIRGLGLNMDQQAGGVMRGRGPGETASEIMARRLDDRLAELRKACTKILKAGENQRKRRAACKRIALVGYTNAGKTSLMNALTSTELSAKNMPFETLDTTSRRLTRHHGIDILLSDTVGFIRKLPQRLLTSFESTLAEILETTLLAIVVDVADPECELHVQTAEEVLNKLKADAIPRLYVFNKIDELTTMPSQEHLCALSRGHEFMVLSSHDIASVARLKLALIHAVIGAQEIGQVFVPYTAGEIIGPWFTPSVE